MPQRTLLPEDAEEMFSSAPCGFLYAAPSGRILRANQTFLTWTGYQADEVENKLRFQDLLTEGGKILYETHMALLLDVSDRPAEMTVDVVRKSGDILPVLVSAKQRRDASGAPAFKKLSLFDARHRRRFEHDLIQAKQRAELDAARIAEQERLLEMALRGSRAGLWLLNVPEDRLEWDELCCEQFGVQPGESKSLEFWLSRADPVDRPSLQGRLQALLESSGDGDLNVEYRVIHPTKGCRWLLAMGQVERNSTGRAVRATGLSFDITERKEFENALQASEAKLNLGMEVAGVAIADIDYRTGTIHLTSAAAQMFGLGQSPVTLPRASVHSTFHEEDRPRLEARISEALDPSGPGWFEMDHRIRLAGGEVRWLRVRKQVEFEAVGSLRGPRRSLLAAMNITDVKEAEAKLRSSELALQRSNESLKHFAYGASHDLRAPLRTIAINAQLIQRMQDIRLTGGAQKLIDRIAETSKGMSQLLSDLLVFAEASDSVDASLEAPANCESILQRTLESLDGTIKERNASITHAPLPNVLVKESHLAQIFFNLLGNSLKYSKDDQPPRIHVSATAEDRNWRLSIKDNGIGIEPEYQDKVFQLFTRLHANEGEFAGTGLGLAICRRIVELYGGRIWLESEPGHGTTVHFTLPAAEAVLEASAFAKAHSKHVQRSEI